MQRGRQAALPSTQTTRARTAASGVRASHMAQVWVCVFVCAYQTHTYVQIFIRTQAPFSTARVCATAANGEREGPSVRALGLARSRRRSLHPVPKRPFASVCMCVCAAAYAREEVEEREISAYLYVFSHVNRFEIACKAIVSHLVHILTASQD